MIPQVLNASGTQVLCEEHGMSAPAPASEEEIQEHGKTLPTEMIGHAPFTPPGPEGKAPHSVMVVLTGTMVEVPYPPPRKAANGI